MANRMILEIPIQPDKLDEFIGMCKGALKDTIGHEGCQQLDWWVAEDGSGRVLFHEVWDSKAHQEKYFAWRVETGFMDAVGPLLAGEPSVTWLTDHEYDA